MKRQALPINFCALNQVAFSNAYHRMKKGSNSCGWTQNDIECDSRWHVDRCRWKGKGASTNCSEL